MRHRLNWVHALPFVALCIAVGVLLTQRTVLQLGEYDHYPEAAEAFARGDFVFDSFHAFGVPLVAAALVRYFGMSGLAACLLLSVIASFFLVWSAGALAEATRQGTGKPVRWLLALNGMTWIVGTTAAADMPAAATFMSGLAVAARSASTNCRGSWGVVAAGLLLGMAPALHQSMLPISLIAALWFAVHLHSPRRLMVLGAAAASGYLTHLVPVCIGGRAVLGDSSGQLYLKLHDFQADELQQAVDSARSWS